MARPRKPDALRISHQPCRTNAAQPTPPVEYPAMPGKLSTSAKKVWPQVCEILYGLGVLTVADGLAVESLCEAYADLRAARAALKARGGLTYEYRTTAGDVGYKTYPEVAIVAEADRRFRMWLSATGLTPSDRSRVDARKIADGDDYAEFVN